LFKEGEQQKKNLADLKQKYQDERNQREEKDCTFKPSVSKSRSPISNRSFISKKSVDDRPLGYADSVNRIRMANHEKAKLKEQSDNLGRVKNYDGTPTRPVTPNLSCFNKLSFLNKKKEPEQILLIMEIVVK